MDLLTFIIIWLINAVAIVVTAFILPGTKVSNFITALMASIVLGLVNAFVRPFLVFFTIPITIITFGLFLFVINAFMVLLTSAIVPGFKVRGFLSALVFSIVLSLINGALFYLFD